MSLLVTINMIDALTAITRFKNGLAKQCRQISQRFTAANGGKITTFSSIYRVPRIIFDNDRHLLFAIVSNGNVEDQICNF